MLPVPSTLSKDWGWMWGLLPLSSRPISKITKAQQRLRHLTRDRRAKTVSVTIIFILPQLFVIRLPVTLRLLPPLTNWLSTKVNMLMIALATIHMGVQSFQTWTSRRSISECQVSKTPPSLWTHRGLTWICWCHCKYAEVCSQQLLSCLINHRKARS